MGVKMKYKTIGAFLGLTALVSGCDNNEERELAACDVGGVQVRAVYHKVVGHDYISFDFYRGGEITGSLGPIKSGWVQCDDGRKLSRVYGNYEVYFTSP